jgi:hypothetical protein
MVKFAPDRERWGYMAFKMRFEEMEAVLGLIKDRAVDLEFREIPIPGEESLVLKKTSNRFLHNNPTDRAIFEDYIKPVFMHSRSLGQPNVHLRDPRLEEAMVKAGRKPTGLSPLMSWLAYKGLVVRDGRGTYRLP